MIFKLLKIKNPLHTYPRLTKNSIVNILKKDIHIPIHIIGILTFIILTVLMISEISLKLNMILGIIILNSSILALFVFYLKKDFPDLLKDDETIVLLSTLIIFNVILIDIVKNIPWINEYITPVGACVMLSSLLVHPRIAMVVSIITCLIFAILHNFSFQHFFVFFFGCIASIAGTMDIKQRNDITKVGIIYIGFVQILALMLLSFFNLIPLNKIFYLMGWTMLNGVLSGIITVGLLPSLEHFFSKTTNLRLIELSDFNQPLLKRMMVETPGTFNHSLQVAILAENAAREINANALLCRVSAYYHDIGKLINPEYFVENQSVIPNLHKNLNPSMSTLIIISHVKDGLALAEKYKLDKLIKKMIPTHHGTSRVEYFYYQALKNNEDIPEEQFRYPGPKPDTKEEAILMLADNIEAASRAIEEPSYNKFIDLIDEIIDKKLKDGQLEDVPLSIKELTTIKNSFLNTLLGIRHKRTDSAIPLDSENKDNKA